jgi:mannose-6-phosphate isomerase-like protein (cupin superfamily)
MSDKPGYHIHTDVRFEPLSLIDIPALVESCEHEWFNQTLTAVNDCVVRLGIIRGEFHWHKHDEEDEFFYVVDGRLHIDLEGRTVELGPKQGFTVPREVVHRTRAPEGAVILMIEGRGVVPTGD